MSTTQQHLSKPASASHPWIGVVAASSWEVRRLLRSGSQAQESPLQPQQGPARFKVHTLRLCDKSVLLVTAGAGAENSFGAAEYLARTFPLCGLASIGFAGGLARGLQTGEVILADRVWDEATGEHFDCDANLLPVRCTRRGNLLSVNAVLCSSERKQDLGEKWQAVAADMEAAGVARAASQAGLPFCAVKAVTDSAEQHLRIDFSRCRREDKDFSVWAIIWQGLTTFKGAADLTRLAWNARQAAATLAAALQ